jgi:hypothetical protein
MDGDFKTFNLRRNKKATSPNRIFCYDTETNPVDGVEVLFLWRAVLVLRHERQPKRDRETLYSGDTADELADAIEEESRKSDTLWVFSHNDNFDLAVTRLPLILYSRGWIITKNALAAGSPWCFLAKGTHRIRIVDSFSVFRCSVKHLSYFVDVDKLDLPAVGSSYESWSARCTNDAMIIARALEIAMDWWDENELGNWSVSGPATGWNAMLHGERAAQTVIQQDDNARKWERDSISGGRREAFKTGNMGEGIYANLDFVSAHATICAAKHLPRKRLRKFDRLPLNARELNLPDYDVIADCIIKESTLEYSVRTDGGIFYPGGRFSTRLCGPEIREGIRNGSIESIGEGYLYRTGPTMKLWGEWILGALDATNPTVPDAAKIMVKGWSRSVPGKWAGRTGRVVIEMPCDFDGWSIEEGFMHPSGIPCITTTMCGRRTVTVKDQEGNDSFPAVLSFIQSWCRLELFHVLSLFDPYVIQCNTDGCIIDVKRFIDDKRPYGNPEKWDEKEYQSQIERYVIENSDKWQPLTLRVKKYAHSVSVLGAQHIVFGGERKFSGIPQNAESIGKGKFRYTAWPSLKTQIRKGDTGGYVTTRRTADLKNIAINRWKTESGDTFPVTMTIDSEGGNRIIVPSPAFHDGEEVLPAQFQHVELAKAMRSEYA